MASRISVKAPISGHVMDNSKGSFINTIAQIGQYIPWFLVHMLWSTITELLVVIDRFSLVSIFSFDSFSSNVVRALLMVRWIVGLILHGVPIDIVLVPATTAVVCVILSVG